MGRLLKVYIQFTAFSETSLEGVYSIWPSVRHLLKVSIEFMAFTETSLEGVYSIWPSVRRLLKVYTVYGLQ